MSENQDLPMYSQRNPRYSHLRMGFSRHTIHNMGCLMCTDAHIGAVDPAAFNRYLAKNGLYVTENSIPTARMVLDCLRPYGWKMKAVWDWKSRRANIDLLKATWDEQDRAVICIKFDAWTPTGSSYHWVEGVKFVETKSGEDIYCYDPWVPSGTWPGLNLLAHYGQPGWDLARAIYMAVIYEKT